MSSQEPSDHLARGDEIEKEEAEQGDAALASKLSKELSNWRRRRSAGRQRNPDAAGGGKFLSEPARTIKVRGHETLVIRKSRLVIKPKAESDPASEPGD